MHKTKKKQLFRLRPPAAMLSTLHHSLSVSWLATACENREHTTLPRITKHRAPITLSAWCRAGTFVPLFAGVRSVDPDFSGG